MTADTSIEWTDATWNPVRGCSIVSPGCTNCYAMKMAHRSNVPGGAYEGLTQRSRGGPVWTGMVRTLPDLLDWPLRRRKPSRIFVNSMSDLFHEDVPDEFILQVFDVMRESANGWTGRLGGERGQLVARHTFQILTKRAERMHDFCSRLRFAQNDGRGMYLATSLPHNGFNPLPAMSNVWLGVSVEDQVRADERIRLLMQTPAAVRWISAEPLLGPVELAGPVRCGRLDWVVVGSESGHRARGMEYQWAMSLRDQCEAAGTAFFMKQIVSAARVKLPFDMFPERLQVREYPAKDPA